MADLENRRAHVPDIARARRWIRTAGYLQRWVALGALIGVVAGLGAVVFSWLLDLSTRLFVHLLIGYHGPPHHGTTYVNASSIDRPWALPLVVGLGGLLSGFLVFRFAPDAEGHGTDAAIAAVHHNPGGIRVRTVLVKLVASALTIGSGGSAGREGPTAQISAGFGSLLARTLRLSPSDARIAVSAGIGSGIGAIFKAPLGGAVLAAEILYRNDMEPEALAPDFVASGVSYVVYGSVDGFTPIFATAGHFQFASPVQLVWFAIIGVAAGLVGLLYARGFYGIGAWFDRMPVTRILRPALGGLAVGCIGLIIPQVLGTGYDWLQVAFTRQALLSMPLALVLVLPFARILATGLSIGSGGSGGIFGPGLVIGGFLGAAIWRILAPIAPWVPHSPAVFVIVGMMACFGSISRAPLAVMLLVASMTASFDAIPPAMLAVGIATVLVQWPDATIYQSQFGSRADLPANQRQSPRHHLPDVSERT